MFYGTRITFGIQSWQVVQTYDGAASVRIGGSWRLEEGAKRALIIRDCRDNMSIRSRVFDIIQLDDGTSLLSRIFDWMITGLILASVIIVFIATFDLPQSVFDVNTFYSFL